MMATSFNQRSSSRTRFNNNNNNNDLNGSRFRSRTSMGFRNNTDFKNAVHDEVSHYLKSKNIPVASIDIHVDPKHEANSILLPSNAGNCTPQRNNYYRIANPYYQNPLATNGSIRLDITTGPTNQYDAIRPKTHFQTDDEKAEENMTYHKSGSPGIPLAFSTYQRPLGWNHQTNCFSPFADPMIHKNNQKSANTSRPVTANEAAIDCMVPNYNNLSWRPPTPMDRSTNSRQRFTTSVAVGPDKHYTETSTNTQKSYQLSDYLKKSMDLNDPYERKIYSSLMDVIRKRARKQAKDCDSIDSQSVLMPDKFTQISEYKAKYCSNNSNKSLQNWIQSNHTQLQADNQFNTPKVNPMCTHKTKLVINTNRPQTSAASKFRHGEQFLY